MKRRLIYLAIAAGVILLGLLWREPALGLPRVAAKYGGSMLWAAMVYFGLRAVLPVDSAGSAVRGGDRGGGRIQPAHQPAGF